MDSRLLNLGASKEHSFFFWNINWNIIFHNRNNKHSSLLRPDKVILGEAKLSPILFCMDAMNWMLDEVKSNKCYTEKIGSNKQVVWKRLVSSKVTLT